MPVSILFHKIYAGAQQDIFCRHIAFSIWCRVAPPPLHAIFIIFMFYCCRFSCRLIYIYYIFTLFSFEIFDMLDDEICDMKDILYAERFHADAVVRHAYEAMALFIFSPYEHMIYAHIRLFLFSIYYIYIICDAARRDKHMLFLFMFFSRAPYFAAPFACHTPLPPPPRVARDEDDKDICRDERWHYDISIHSMFHDGASAFRHSDVSKRGAGDMAIWRRHDDCQPAKSAIFILLYASRRCRHCRGVWGRRRHEAARPPRQPQQRRRAPPPRRFIRRAASRGQLLFFQHDSGRYIYAAFKRGWLSPDMIYRR